MRILLVEDSPDNCTIAVAYLEDTPYRVEIAETGASACEMFAAGHYDLVLMDVRMPRLDGVAATRRIVAGLGEQAPRILVLTTLDQDALAADAIEAGASGFLLKEAQPELLLAAIRAWKAS